MTRRFLADPLALGPVLSTTGAAVRREGLAETTDIERHIHDKILAVLFTRPGERVMRPRFGAGLDRQVFEAISPLALSAVEFRIRDSLERGFEDEILLEDVRVRSGDDEGTILIAIDYALRTDRLPRTLEVLA
jgi:phage baseplate assembly protein W